MQNELSREKTGEGVNFERVRRITGYLVGTTDRWNNAKKAELDDRVTHATLNITKVSKYTPEYDFEETYEEM